MPTYCWDASAEGCASGLWRSTRTAKARCSTAVTTGPGPQPRRMNIGLHRAAVLGLRLIGDDVELRSAIRRALDRAVRTPRSRHGTEDLVAQRCKLLRPYYHDKVGADLIAEEEARLSVALREAQREADDASVEMARADDVGTALRCCCAYAPNPRRRQDVEGRATEVERRVFIEEITGLPDYLDVKVHGTPPVTSSTRRLDSRSRVSIVSEGGHTNPDWRLNPWVGP